MLRLLIVDALFSAAVLLQTLAALNMFRSLWNWPMRPEFEPILAFYQTSVAPLSSFPARYILATKPGWYADAYMISVVLGFLFVIRQARRAMAPHDDVGGEAVRADQVSRTDGIIDTAFVYAVCIVAALAFSLALLPLLTPVIALFLLALQQAGRPSWFAVSPTYYLNLFAVAGLTAVTLSLSR